MIGNIIYIERRKMGLSQESLAEKLSIPQETVSGWEDGISEPDLENLLKLSEIFGISTDSMLKDEIEAETEYFSQTPENTASGPNSAGKRRGKRFWLLPVAISAAIILIAIGIFAFKAFGSFSDNPKAIAEATKSVVMLYCYDKDNKLVATASGFVLYDSQTVITNYHVIDGTYSIKAETESGLSFPLEKVLNYDKNADVAILQTSTKTGLVPLQEGKTSSLQKGEKIIAIGSPLGMKNTVSNGIVSGNVPENGVNIIQITASISPGSSGGALFDNSGKIVGITSATLKDGQNINFAVPIEEAAKLHADTSKAVELATIYMPKKDENYRKKCIEVSLEELYAHPKNYDGKDVAVTAWDAFYAYYDPVSKEHFYQIYLINDKSRFLGNKQLSTTVHWEKYLGLFIWDYFDNYIKPYKTPYVDAIIYNNYVGEAIDTREKKMTVYGHFTYNPSYTENGGYVGDPQPYQIEVHDYHIY